VDIPANSRISLSSQRSPRVPAGSSGYPSKPADITEFSWISQQSRGYHRVSLSSREFKWISQQSRGYH
jgi:hypothetical protein